MKERHFWRVIRRAGAGPAGVLALLAQWPAPEVIRLHRKLVEVHQRAYRWDVLVAFGIVLGELNIGLVTDAISWLVLRGKRTFRDVLVDPDALARLTINRCEVGEARWLLRIASERLEPPHEPDDDMRLVETAITEVLGDVDFRRPPPGELPTLDAESLRLRYPRLAARFPLDGVATALWPAPSRRRDVVSDA